MAADRSDIAKNDAARQRPERSSLPAAATPSWRTPCLPAGRSSLSRQPRRCARRPCGSARREHSIVIVDAIHAWAYRQRALPESSVGKAIARLLGLWPGLTPSLNDARVPLDNNATERGLRKVVVDRKIHYGSAPTEGPRSRRSSTPPSRPRSSPA